MWHSPGCTIIGIQHIKLCFSILCLALTPLHAWSHSVFLSLTSTCSMVQWRAVNAIRGEWVRCSPPGFSPSRVHSGYFPSPPEPRRIKSPAADPTAALQHDGWLHIRCLNRVAAPSAEGFGKSGVPEWWMAKSDAANQLSVASLLSSSFFLHPFLSCSGKNDCLFPPTTFYFIFLFFLNLSSSRTYGEFDSRVWEVSRRQESAWESTWIVCRAHFIPMATVHSHHHIKVNRAIVPPYRLVLNDHLCS